MKKLIICIFLILPQLIFANDELLLFNALKLKDYKQIKDLSKEVDIDLNIAKYSEDDNISKMYITPLAMSIINNDTEMALLLIDIGADVSKSSNVFVESVINKNNKLTYALLKKGIDPNQPSAIRQNKSYALTVAILYKDIQLVKTLISHGASLALEDEQTTLTPMHAAAVSGKDYVQALIDAKGDINIINSGGFTPISAAVIRNDKDMVEFLIKKKADLHIEKENANPLWVAIKLNRYEIAKLLVNNNGITPNINYLSYAITFGNIDMVKIFLDNMDINMEQGKALNTAIATGNLNITKILIENGALYNPEEAILLAAMYSFCIEGGGIEIMKYLYNKHEYDDNTLYQQIDELKEVDCFGYNKIIQYEDIEKIKKLFLGETNGS